jgi:transcriptional regulator with XRE-family HTH domain
MMTDDHKLGTEMALPGPALRQLRKSKGLSQMQLAAISGVDQTMVSMLEMDKSKGSPSIWQRIFRALGLDYTQDKEAV